MGLIYQNPIRQAAIHAGRILKGEKPANLPVVQPTKFCMAINSKVAKSLNSPRLLGLADEIVEEGRCSLLALSVDA